MQTWLGWVGRGAASERARRAPCKRRLLQPQNSLPLRTPTASEVLSCVRQARSRATLVLALLQSLHAPFLPPLLPLLLPPQVHLAADRLIMEGLLAESLELLRHARPDDANGAAALLRLAGEAPSLHSSQLPQHARRM